MFEAAEIKHKLDKATFKREEPRLRKALLDAQAELGEKKPIEVVTCAELGVAVQPRTTLLRTAAPSQRPAGTRVQSVAELVQRLRDEAKVI